MLFDYDKNDERSILNYAKKMEGMTYNDMLTMCKEYIDMYQNGVVSNRDKEFVNGLIEDTISTNFNAKGQLGSFIEKFYFGYEPNGNQEADLKECGIEIKQTPIDITKNNKMRAGERLSITMISFNDPVEENFYQSHLWEKIRRILLIHYIRDKSINRLDYQIQFVNLFTPPPEDIKIIIEDYNKINKKIKEGKAHEISEEDTLYLGACTKGSTAASMLRPQYYGDHIPAKRRNYCFKQSYMNYILNNYVLTNSIPYESIIKTDIDKSFADYVLHMINQYRGKTDKELCQMFDREYNNNKAQWNDLSFRMLGIKGNHAAEFEKANIVVKTIRIEQNGKNKESMSFAPFKFKELIQEEWENSTLFNYFDSTQFLFVVFKNNGESYTLLGAKLWHIPYSDLNVTVKEEWNKCKETIINGVRFCKKKNKKGDYDITNNLPGMNDTQIIHVRPHATKSAYKLQDGYIKGDVKKDGDELPNGEWMTKQSFWFNGAYVLKQIQDIGGE